MEHQLDNSHPVYIVMTVTGVVDKPGIIAGISELMNHPDYQTKHTLWDFTQGKMGLSMGDLKEIAGVLRLYRNRNKSFANRSALLVPSMMELSMAKVYISITKLLPFDYKVFQTKDDAHTFLTG